MFSFLSKILQNHAIECFAPIRLSDCRILKPYLLERAGMGAEGTVIMLAVPYFSPACLDNTRNLSAYAVSRDYHLFFSSLFEKILPELRAHYPGNRFAGFADHSPIAEIEAAAAAGLGMIGCNRMLITPRYSSYVFLGELITDAQLPAVCHPIETCEACGKCQNACPAAACGTCLSALTQKKGELAAEEVQNLLKHRSAWGCDLCQEVCPHTVKALKSGSIYTKIPFFYENTISHLTSERLDQMDEATFSERAFAWRGRETIRRNLLLLEARKGDSSC